MQTINALDEYKRQQVEALFEELLVLLKEEQGDVAADYINGFLRAKMIDGTKALIESARASLVLEEV